MRKRGVSFLGSLAPVIGITPATSREIQSRAERILSEDLAERTRDVKPRENERRDEMRRQMIRDLRLGKDVTEEYNQAVASGLFSKRQLQNIFHAGAGSALLAKFKAVLAEDLPAAIDAWDAATDDERREMLPELLKKRARLYQAAPEEARRYLPMIDRALRALPQLQPMPAPAPAASP
jgi:hypothetical protein